MKEPFLLGAIFMTAKKIVVLDVGKTNKKLFVYDSHLNCLNPDEEGVKLEPVQWQLPSGENLECDDMQAICRWMTESLKRAAEEYGDIGAISISAHGATIALLGKSRDEVFDGDGGLVFPVVSYENEISSELEDGFYESVGIDPIEAHKLTATPKLSWLLNSLKTVFLLQNFHPGEFEKVTDILMFPQYLGYLLCGQKGIEPTYPGCHSYFLNASGNGYSRLADKLGVVGLLPDLPMGKPWDVLGRITPAVSAATGLPSECVVTMGVHDSNAAIVPYLAKGLDNFVVQDSGTWVVTMAPQTGGEAVFSENELGLEVFYNRDIYGGPVKTTIFRGGAEFEFYRKKVLADRPHPDHISIDIVGEIASGREVFSLPTIERGAGLFPESLPRFEGVDIMFRDSETAWHVIDMGLAIQGYHALTLTGGDDISQVYIEGNIGRYNPIYRGVISTLFEESDVYYGSMGGAVFGAAVLGVAAMEGRPPEDLEDRYEMGVEMVEKLDMDSSELKDYARGFLERAGKM